LVDKKKKPQKPLIFNASPLIYFCKVGFSNIFKKLAEDKYTTLKVEQEVVSVGKSKGFSDAFIVEELINTSIINVANPKNKIFIKKLEKIPNLHEAEIQVLALAKEMDGIAILDEGLAREVGKMYFIEVHGSAYLLLRLFQEKVISNEKARKTLDDMIGAGWRLSAEDYARIIREFM